jgi:O-acetyl-ADP-ribose deacetylase (regulator of RNase III)
VAVSSVSIAGLRALRLRGAGMEAVRLAETLPVDAEPGRIAIEVVGTLRELGRFAEADRYLRTLKRAELDRDCCELLLTQASLVRLFMRLDIGQALRRARRRIRPTGQPVGADQAEAERLRCAIILIGAAMGEVREAEQEATYSRMLAAAQDLEQAGRLAEALLARKVCAERSSLAVPERLAGLEAVANQARQAGQHGIEGDIFIKLAEHFLVSGGTALEVTERLDAADAAFERVGHLRGPLDVACVRAVLAARPGIADFAVFDRLREQYEALGAEDGQIQVLLSVTRLALDASEPDIASRAIDRMTAISERAGNRLLRGSYLAAQAQWLFTSGLHSRTRALCEAELALPLPAGMRAAFLSLLSGALSMGGDHDQALAAARATYALYAERHDQEGVSIACSRITTELVALQPAGWLAEVRSLLLRAVADDAAQGAADRAVARLIELASNLLAQANSDASASAVLIQEAEALLDRAAAMAEPLPLRQRGQRLGDIMRNRSLAAALRGDMAAQAEHMSAGVRLFEAAGLRLQAAEMNYLLGCLEYNETERDMFGHFGAAETALNAALSFYDHAGMRERLAQASEILARLYLRSADAVGGELAPRMRAAALGHLGKAELGLDVLRRDYRGVTVADTRRGKQAFTRDAQQICDTALRVLVGRLEDWQQVWEWVQRAKSRQLNDLLGASTGVPAHVRKRIIGRPALEALVAEEQDLVRAMARTRPEHVAALRLRHDGILGQLAAEPDLREYLALRTGGIDTGGAWEAFCRAGAGCPSGAVMVDWFRAADRLFVITRRPDRVPDVRCLDLTPSRVSELAQVYLAPHNLGATLRDRPDVLAAFDPLIAPLSELTAAEEHLVLCPTAPMHGIPLHALAIGGRPLLERNPVSYTPSLGILHHCLVRDVHRAMPPHVALLGNPSGDRPGSEALLAELSARFKSHPVLREAVTISVLQAALNQSDIVNFHGHALYDPADAMQSRLLLADGVMTARDLFERVGIGADLIVLCACASGSNRIQEGDEPVGLVPALQVAGARRVLATMWPVSDTTATQLMRQFYALLPDQGAADLARSLRAAALAVRDSGRSEPYYWAPFILDGDWNWAE